MSALTLEQISTRSGAVLDEVERAVVGKRPELELVLLAILADGHVLIEDYPGLAKTLVARSFAQVLDLGFARIQFTPDLLPADVTGSSIYRQGDGTFEFRPGPVFTNLLLADEINRAPPKTQSALLESMAERQVTVEGETHVLDRPFLVIATQNPIEYEGTYPLPEAQLDRFLVRARIGYPSRDDEWQVLERRRERMTDEVVLAPACARDELLAMQRPSRRCTSTGRSASTWSTWSPRPATTPRSRSGRARAARSRSSSSRAAGRRSTAATSSRPTT